MQYFNLVLCVVMGVLVQTIPQRALGEGVVSESLESLFENARRAQAEIPPRAFDVEEQDFNARVAPDGDPNTPVQRSEYSVRGDGDQFEALYAMYILLPGRESVPNTESRKWWDGERVWGRDAWPYNKSDSVFTVKEGLSSQKSLQFDQSSGAFLEGRFQHNHDGAWFDILDDESGVTLDENTEAVDGYECHVVSGTTPHGTYRLWIDSEHGYGLRRATITVEDDQLAWGKKLSDFETRGMDSRIATIEMEIAGVAIKEFEGHFIATEGILTQSFSYSDGREEQLKKVVKRGNFQLNPDFDAMGAFQVDFPEGASVLYKSEGGIRLRYTWRNGLLAPEIDVKALTQIDESIDELSELARKTGTASSLADTAAISVQRAKEAEEGLLSSSGVQLGTAAFALLILVMVLFAVRSHLGRLKYAQQ
jgi:hypothetical protein